MTLPLETINGKQYQPVERKKHTSCNDCVFGKGVICNVYSCLPTKRKDGLDIYYIEPGDTNEQEQ